MKRSVKRTGTKRTKSAPPPTDPILRHDDVLELVGISRETLWRWRREGLFPLGFKVNRRGDLGWRTSEVMAWLDKRDECEVLL